MRISLDVTSQDNIISVSLITDPPTIATEKFSEMKDEHARRCIIAVAHAIEWLKTAARQLDKEFHFYQNDKLILATSPENSENTKT